MKNPTPKISGDLALELKAAGFPQKGDTVFIGANDEVAVEPSLEELIDACGEEFDKLQLEETRPNKWFAYGGEAMFTLCGIGSTPEEAVARLWLALNKKI